MNDSTTPLWLQVPEPSDLVKAFGSAVDVPAFGGRLEVNCRTVGRKDALDNRRPLRFSQNTASRPRIEPLVRAQVARRTHFDWTKPDLASEAGRVALSRREKTPQLRFN